MKKTGGGFLCCGAEQHDPGEEREACGWEREVRVRGLELEAYAGGGGGVAERGTGS